MLSECGRAYYGEDYERSGFIPDTDIILNATSAFPPSYISDGNTGSFTDQAEDLYRRLTDLGVNTEFTYYDKQTEILGHGFEIFSTACGEDNLNKTIRFLNTALKGAV